MKLMKKILAICALAVSGAVAAGPTVGLQYDHDNVVGSVRGKAQEAKLSIAQDTQLGTFDFGLTKFRFKSEGIVGHDDAHGFEAGYSNTLTIGRVGLTGRVAYGRINNVDPNGGGFTGNTSYGSFAAEASTPVASRVNAFVGYRHRNSFNSEMAPQNRYTLGADVALSKELGLRAGVAHTRQGGYSYNGFTTALTYSF